MTGKVRLFILEYMVRHDFCGTLYLTVPLGPYLSSQFYSTILPWKVKEEKIFYFPLTTGGPGWYNDDDWQGTATCFPKVKRASGTIVASPCKYWTYKFFLFFLTGKKIDGILWMTGKEWILFFHMEIDKRKKLNKAKGVPEKVGQSKNKIPCRAENKIPCRNIIFFLPLLPCPIWYTSLSETASKKGKRPWNIGVSTFLAMCHSLLL